MENSMKHTQGKWEEFNFGDGYNAWEFFHKHKKDTKFIKQPISYLRRPDFVKRWVILLEWIDWEELNQDRIDAILSLYRYKVRTIKSAEHFKCNVCDYIEYPNRGKRFTQDVITPLGMYNHVDLNHDKAIAKAEGK